MDNKSSKQQILNVYREIFGDLEAFALNLTNCENLTQTVFRNREDGAVAAVGFARTKNIRIFGKVERVAFIFGIGTEEKSRGSGFASSMVTELLQKLAKEFTIVMLSPAEDGLVQFYNRFGFCLFDSRVKKTNETCEIEKSVYVDYLKNIPEIDEDKKIEKHLINSIDNTENAERKERYKRSLYGLVDGVSLFNEYNRNADIAQYKTFSDAAAKAYEVMLGGGFGEVEMENGKMRAYRLVEDGELSEEITDNPPTKEAFLSRRGKYKTMMRILNPIAFFNKMYADKTLCNTPTDKDICGGKVDGCTDKKNDTISDVNETASEGVQCYILRIQDPILGDSELQLKVVDGKVSALKGKIKDAKVVDTDVISFNEWLFGRKLLKGETKIPYPFGVLATAFYDRY